MKGFPGSFLSSGLKRSISANLLRARDLPDLDWDLLKAGGDGGEFLFGLFLKDSFFSDFAFGLLGGFGGLLGGFGGLLGPLLGDLVFSELFLGDLTLISSPA